MSLCLHLMLLISSGLPRREPKMPIVADAYRLLIFFAFAVAVIYAALSVFPFRPNLFKGQTQD